MTFYVQGDAVGSLETSSTFTVPSSKLYLAAFSETVYQKFGGALDEIGIWNRAISEGEVVALYNASLPVMGCTDASACNFDEEATLDDGSCVSCDLVASFCGLGTIWDQNTQTCIGDGSGDINFDGCVQLNDLLDLLSAYGNCSAEESVWQCGDPLEYQGYDYETVQIGEQCWFAENLRAGSYRNGDVISSNIGDSEWLALTEGATVVFGQGNLSCDATFDGQNACNEDWALEMFGRLYNGYAAVDSRGLCPTEWHVPLDSEWMGLETTLGMVEDELTSTAWRGSDQGAQMKTQAGWSNDGGGNNTSGFSGVPAGDLTSGQFVNGFTYGTWWSSTEVGSDMAWKRFVGFNDNRVYRSTFSKQSSFSIRCIKDSE